jgi:hypothetical protein
VGRRRRLALLIALALATVLLVAPAIARQVLAGDAGNSRPPVTAPGGSPATLPPG